MTTEFKELRSSEIRRLAKASLIGYIAECHNEIRRLQKLPSPDEPATEYTRKAWNDREKEFQIELNFREGSWIDERAKLLEQALRDQRRLVLVVLRGAGDDA